MYLFKFVFRGAYRLPWPVGGFQFFLIVGSAAEWWACKQRRPIYAATGFALNMRTTLCDRMEVPAEDDPPPLLLANGLLEIRPPTTTIIRDPCGVCVFLCRVVSVHHVRQTNPPSFTTHCGTSIHETACCVVCAMGGTLACAW